MALIIQKPQLKEKPEVLTWVAKAQQENLD